MSRPRWHDVLLVSAIIGLFAVGIWSLWGDELRAALHLSPAGGSAGSGATSVAAGST